MKNRVLIIGYGASGQRYFKIIKKKFPNSEIKVFSKLKKNEKFFLKKLSEIESFKPDTIFMCNPSSERIKYLKYIKKTKNVFFEKPLSNNYRSGKKILKAMSNKKNILLGYNLRFLNILTKVKKNLNNYVGRVYSFDCESGSFLPEWRKINYKQSVSAQKKLGGGALLELSHEMDYINWIFGTNYKMKSFFINSKILNINVEDNVKIIFNFSNKILGSLSLDFLNQKKTRLMTINGTKGSLKVDLIKNTLNLISKNQKSWVNIPFKKNTVKSTYTDIVNFFFKKKKLVQIKPSLKQGLLILKNIDQLKKSKQLFL